MLSKTQVDKVGERLKSGDVDASTITALEQYRGEFAESYKAVEFLVRDRLGHDVTGRPAKSTVAITEKLRRQSIRLSQVQDIAGCRVIVPTVLAQDSLSNVLQVFYSDLTIDDKRESPTNGYRALHLIPRVNGKFIEVQVRTELQHTWADVSERLADVHGQDVKYGKGEPQVVEYLAKFSRAVHAFEKVGRKNLEFHRASFPYSQRHDRKKLAKELSKEMRLSSYEIKSIIKQLPKLGLK